MQRLQNKRPVKLGFLPFKSIPALGQEEFWLLRQKCAFHVNPQESVGAASICQEKALELLVYLLHSTVQSWASHQTQGRIPAETNQRSNFETHISFVSKVNPFEVLKEYNIPGHATKTIIPIIVLHKGDKENDGQHSCTKHSLSSHLGCRRRNIQEFEGLNANEQMRICFPGKL